MSGARYSSARNLQRTKLAFIIPTSDMIIFPANQPLVIDQNSFLSTIQPLHQQVEARSVEAVLGLG